MSIVRIIAGTLVVLAIIGGVISHRTAGNILSTPHTSSAYATMLAEMQAIDPSKRVDLAGSRNALPNQQSAGIGHTQNNGASVESRQSALTNRTCGLLSPVATAHTPLAVDSLQDRIPSVGFRPRIALYPLVPAAEIEDTELTWSAMTRTNERFAAALSSIETVSLLDRAVQNHPLLPQKHLDIDTYDSPSRMAADYIISGTARYAPEPSLVIELVHVTSAQVVKQFTVNANYRLALDMQPIAQAVATAVRADTTRRMRHTNAVRMLAVTSIFTPTDDTSMSFEARQLEDQLISGILNEPDYGLIARRHLLALELETRLLGTTHHRAAPDVAIDGRLLKSVNTKAGTAAHSYSLLLYLQRLGGLRKAFLLESSDVQTLADQAIELIAANLPVQACIESSQSEKSDQLTDDAWSIMSNSDYSLAALRRWEGYFDASNTDALRQANKILDQAVALDPHNARASGLKSMVVGMLGDASQQIALLDELMWHADPRVFQFGKFLMDRRFRKGTLSPNAKIFDGLPGPLTGEDLIESLIAEGLLRDVGVSGKRSLFYAYSSALNDQFDEHSMREAMQRAITSPASEYIRYKIAREYASKVTVKAPRSPGSRYYNNQVYLGITTHPEAQMVYRIAISRLPVLLKVDTKDLRWISVDLPLADLEHYSRQAIQEHMQLTGTALFSDALFFESELLHASMVCYYSRYLCAHAQLMLLDTLENSKALRQGLSGRSNNKSKEKDWLDGMFAMAERVSAPLTETLENAVTSTAKRATDNHDEQINTGRLVGHTRIAPGLENADLFKLCNDCPQYLKHNLTLSTPDGAWNVVSQSYDDVIATFRSEFLPESMRAESTVAALKHWLFDNGYLDIKGLPIVKRPDYNLMSNQLRASFPHFTQFNISGVYNAYKRTSSVEHGGSVALYTTNVSKPSEPTLLIAPDAMTDRQFGRQIFMGGAGQMSICDGNGNLYDYRETGEHWKFVNQIEAECVRKVVASNYLVSTNRDFDLMFSPVSETTGARQQVRKPLNDFTEYMGERSYLKSLWSVDGRVFVALETRHANRAERVHAVLVYENFGGAWRQSSIIETPEEPLQIVGTKDRVYLRTSKRVAVLHLDMGSRWVAEANVVVPDSEYIRGDIATASLNGDDRVIFKGNNLLWSW